MPIVKMPDGKQVKFPDDMPTDEIRALIKEHYSADVQKMQAGGSAGTPGNPANPDEPAYKEALAQGSAASQQLKGPVDNPNQWRRGTLAPVERNEQSGALRLAVPQIALDAMSAFQLPGDVMSGKVDPMSPEGLDRSALFGSMAAGGNALPSKVVAPSAAKAALVSGADNSTSREIKSAASALFDSAKSSGVTIAPDSYKTFIEDVTRKVVDSGLDKTLHPDTYAALTNLLKKRGNGLTFKDLHIARQIAQDASRSQLARDGTKARTIVTAIDDFVNGLTPADIHYGADPTQAAGALKTGIEMWSKGSKVSTLEDAIYRAQNAASGLENGLRVEFRKLLQDSSSRNMFSPDELKAIEGVVRGTAGSNIVKLIGKFGFGNGQAGNALGGAVGFGAGSMTPLGPLGGIIAAIGAAGARKASEKMTAGAADAAINVITHGQRKAPNSLVSLPAKSMGPAYLTPYEANQNRRGPQRAIESTAVPLEALP